MDERVYLMGYLQADGTLKTEFSFVLVATYTLPIKTYKSLRTGLLADLGRNILIGYD